LGIASVKLMLEGFHWFRTTTPGCSMDLA
jgi:hypothetical protein